MWESVDTLILGAGITGITAAYCLRQRGVEALICEKEGTYGGLCGSFTIDGFTFDTFAHLNFSVDPFVRSLLEEKTEYITHRPEAFNYYKGQWIRNPVQNNLSYLDEESRIKVICDFVNKKRFEICHNYDEWLRDNYGNYFTDEFPGKYTRKYWTVDASMLEIKWAEGRMYVPSLEEMLRGAFTKNTPNVHYSKEMHYPCKGGYKGFLDPLAGKVRILCNSEAEKIDAKEKTVYFKEGRKIRYKNLISTIPLTEMGHLLDGMPAAITDAVNGLDYTSGVLVSLGFNREKIPPALWYYIYDEEIPPARVYAPNLKAPSNAPDHCSSLQAEIYFSKYKPIREPMDEIGEKTIEQLIKTGLFTKADIVVKDFRVKKYANIMFTPEIYNNREKIRRYLGNLGIMTAGRFGEWDYLWTGQSMLSGKKAAALIDP